MSQRSIRLIFSLIVLLVSAGGALYSTAPKGSDNTPTSSVADKTADAKSLDASVQSVRDQLNALEVKGRAPKTGYAREQFGAGWSEIDGCDTRNTVLQRDPDNIALSDDGCTVLSGTLDDPYTGRLINFQRGSDTSSAVQIDHVVALSNAWQTGAQALDEADRTQFANDPDNLLAVDGPTNNKKGDSDAATWLPPNKNYRCPYVSRQVYIKTKYHLWVTSGEKQAIDNVLISCDAQLIQAS